MGPVAKLASVLLVILALGALQIAVPSFNSSSTQTSSIQMAPAALASPAMTSSTDAIVLPANTASWQAQNYLQARRGSLYFAPDDNAAENETEPGLLLPVPILKTQVKIHVSGIVARTRVSQTFKNPGSEWVNGLYVFPLPENAAVDHMQMQIGERVIEGQIKEKQQAKEIYQQAVAEGKKASLVVQQRPNLFTNSVANIGPGETISVTIEYQQTLSLDNGSYQLRFPMTITPRYQPAGTDNDRPVVADPESENVVQPVFAHSDTSAEDLSLEVILHTGFAVDNIHSAYQPINTTRLGEGDYVIELKQPASADQDFVLSWQPRLSNEPVAIHLQQQLNGWQYGLMMLMPPAAEDAAVSVRQKLAREVIFVLDTSGSMSGISLIQAKQALMMALDDLTVADRFNLIEFNSYAQKLWPQSKTVSAQSVVEARTFIEHLSANGGTEMTSALDLALSQEPSVRRNDSLRQVIFITDGSVGNEESLMSLISEKLQQSRLFTVGIGSAPNSYFMTEAALMGRGTYTYIGSVEEVHLKMQQLLRKLAHPALTDLHLRINGQLAELIPQFDLYPSSIADLYQGEPLVLSYRMPLNTSAVDFSTALNRQPNLYLEGMYRSAPWQTMIDTQQARPESGLDVLWARDKIAQLTRDQRKALRDGSDNAQAVPMAEHYRDLITQTALEHHLVSQYTSLIAVDVTPSKPANVQSYQHQVANTRPKGSGNGALAHLPQTATAAQLHLLLGSLITGIALCLLGLYRKNIR